MFGIRGNRIIPSHESVAVQRKRPASTLPICEALDRRTLFNVTVDFDAVNGGLLTVTGDENANDIRVKWDVIQEHYSLELNGQFNRLLPGLTEVSISGMAGNDYIWVAPIWFTGTCTLEGNDDADQIFGARGNDDINGGAGDDSMLAGNEGIDIIHGEGGNDGLSGGPGKDQLYCGDGVDFAEGGTENDTIDGGNTDNSADYLHGDAGNDTVKGFGGNDHLFGGDGDDTLEGGDGDDTIEGGDDGDTIDGGAGLDDLYAGSNTAATVTDGVDVLRGGADEDTLTGDEGGDGLGDFFYGDGADDSFWTSNGEPDFVDGGDETWNDMLHTDDWFGGDSFEGWVVDVENFM